MWSVYASVFLVDLLMFLLQLEQAGKLQRQVADSVSASMKYCDQWYSETLGNQDTKISGHIDKRDTFGCPKHPVHVYITMPEIRMPH